MEPMEMMPIAPRGLRHRAPEGVTLGLGLTLARWRSWLGLTCGLNFGLMVLGSSLGMILATIGPVQALSASQRPGDRGPSVSQLQRQLALTGEYQGQVTGVFDGRTTAALRAFQTARNLFAKGEVDIATKQSLLDATGHDRLGLLTADLQVGDSGPSVQELQTLLQKVAIYRGSITSVFGAETDSAVRAFQRSRRLAMTGQVDLATMQQLRLIGTIATSPNNTGSTSTSSARNRTADFTTTPGADRLQPGSQGPAVRALQQALQAAGFFRRNVTGYYGAVTTTAVRNYQRSRGLPVTGVAGSETLAALASGQPAVALAQPSRSSVVANPPARAMSTTMPIAQPMAQPIARPSASQRMAIQRMATQPMAVQSMPMSLEPGWILAPGQSGPAVGQLQRKLQSIGLFRSTVTGYYGPRTAAAVQTYQRSRRLPMTGIADSATLQSLGLVDLAATGYGVVVMRPPVTARPANTVKSGTIADYTPLSLGARVDRVRLLQTRLAEFGLLPPGRETGFFGGSTEAAVRAFQRSRGLPVTGIADLKTQVALGL